MKPDCQLKIGEDSERHVEGWKLLDGRVGGEFVFISFQTGWTRVSQNRSYVHAPMWLTYRVRINSFHD